MTLQEFVNTMAFGIVLGISNYDGTQRSMETTYNHEIFFMPRVYCKDGFNISIQVSNGNYAGSERGYHTFGTDWKLVEWGYPSEVIDAKKYNAEDENTKKTVGSVETSVLEELIQEHGGIDLQKTLQN